MARERSIKVELPATIIMTVRAENKAAGKTLVQEIFGKRPLLARLTSHRDSDNIAFAVKAQQEEAKK